MILPASPVASPVTRLATGMAFTEGPCWLADHQRLVFTDIPANRIMAWDARGLSVWTGEAHFAIGLTRARDGRVLACEHSTRTLSALTLSPGGSPAARQVLSRSLQGRVLNSTNDVCVARDGTILFTDPPFGVRAEDGALYGYQQAMELPFCGVFRATEDADAPALLTADIYRPNGLTLSPDERTLYVSDSSDRHHKTLAFDVGPGWTLSNLRDFAVMPIGVPDGLRCDAEGNLWVAGGDGLHVHAPDGRQIGHAPVPEMVTNLTFGGADGRDVFITAVTSLYHLRSAIPGA
jgi:gluconolactonase